MRRSRMEHYCILCMTCHPSHPPGHPPGHPAPNPHCPLKEYRQCLMTRSVDGSRWLLSDRRLTLRPGGGPGGGVGGGVVGNVGGDTPMRQATGSNRSEMNGWIIGWMEGWMDGWMATLDHRHRRQNDEWDHLSPGGCSTDHYITHSKLDRLFQATIPHSTRIHKNPQDSTRFHKIPQDSTKFQINPTGGRPN